MGSRALNEQLAREVDRLRFALTRNEEAVKRSKDEAAAFVEGKEQTRQERDQFQLELGKACEELAAAKVEASDLRASLARQQLECGELEAQLQKRREERDRVCAARDQLQQVPIGQWLL